MARQGTGAPCAALSAFCARLKRLQEASGLTQTALAHHARLGKSQMSTILNGKIKQIPDWDMVRLVVCTCLEHAAKSGKTLQPDLGDERDWQRRYSDLEQDTELAQPPRGQEAPPHGRPIGQWDPFSLGVHPPITAARHSPYGPVDLPALPPYMPREHDQQLRELLKPRQPGPRMVVLVGGSCTGKTRAAYEGICSCLPQWRLTRPETSADLVDLLTGQTLGSETVLWLNETQVYLDGEHGEEAAAALRRLLSSTLRIVIVGTMWDTDWHVLTARPAAGAPGHPQARELLDQSTVKIAVPACFAGQAMTHLRRAAREDPRLAEAFHAAWGTGEIAQVLAGGPWLIDFYKHGSDPHTKAVLDAAVDAWLLGHRAPLPAEILEEGAVGYLDERQRAVSAAWFHSALAQATAKIKDAVAPLTAIRIRHGAGAPDGYLLADYLLQYASMNRRPSLPPVELWDALASHTRRADDHVRIAESALGRSYRCRAALHFRSAIGSSGIGDSPACSPEALQWGLAANLGDRLVISPNELFLPSVAPTIGHAASGGLMRVSGHGDPGWSARRGMAQLLEQAGRIDEAAELQRYLADRGDTAATQMLADLLERTGRIDEAAGVWQPTAESGDITAMRMLADLLERAGRIDEAVAVSQQLADRGHGYAMETLAGLLEKARKPVAAAAIWRQLAERGDIYAMRMLAQLLEHGGQIDEAAAVWRPAAGRDEAYAIEALAGVLERAGHVDEATALWQAAAQRGDATAMRMLAELLERAGRIDEAVKAWQAIAESGDVTAMRTLASLLEHAGRIDEATAVWKRAGQCGDPLAIDALARVLGRAGRIDEAVAVWQHLAESDETDYPVRELTGLLEQADRIDEAIAVWQPAAETGDTNAKRVLTRLLERVGRINEAIAVWQPAAEVGDAAAMRMLALILKKAGQLSIAEKWLRNAAQLGDAESVAELTRLLRMAGRPEESQQIMDYGLEPGGRTANPWT